MKKLAGLAATTLLVILNPANAQDDVLILDNDAQFDGDFIFDDDLFGDAFDEDSSTNTRSWLDDFTIRS